MDFKFFADCTTLQDLKSEFKKLVFRFHPDRMGTDASQETIDQATETMKQINLEYEQAFEYIKTHPVNEREKRAYFYADIEDGFREAIEKIVFIPNIDITICGSWVWVGGETKPVKDLIKQAGYNYQGFKKMWFWKPADYQVKKGHKAWDMDKIKDVYGAIHVDNREHTRIDN